MENKYSYKIDKEALLELINDLQSGRVREVYDIEVDDNGYCEVITDKAYYLITEQ